MNTTTFLTQLWGPIILAVGLGFFINRSFYLRLYRDLQREPLAILIFGMVAMLIGILHISIHNYWGSFSVGLISFLGWATLIKGIAFVVVPDVINKVADWEIAQKLAPSKGVLAVVAGIYITWIGYFV